MRLDFINQILETEQAFCFTINKFTINESFRVGNLLNTKVFDISLRPKVVQVNSGNTANNSGYLKGLFYSSRLKTSDFRLMAKGGIFHYLEGFSDSEQEWGESKSDFKSLLSKFIAKVSVSLDDCYLINREWFNTNSGKVREREFSLYDFYFIIIWLDKRDPSTLYISEWSGD